MSNGCRELGEFGRDDWGKFLSQDPACIFTKGACHAYAIELFRSLFGESPTSTVSILAIGANSAGEHVVVRAGEKYLDVTMGPIAPEKLRYMLVTNEVELCSPPVPLPSVPPDTGAVTRRSTRDFLPGLRKKMAISGEDSTRPQQSPPVTGSVNRFGHRIDQPFLDSARSKAREHIDGNRAELLRLARPGSEGTK